jgi:hypothetical protein
MPCTAASRKILIKQQSYAKRMSWQRRAVSNSTPLSTPYRTFRSLRQKPEIGHSRCGSPLISFQKTNTKVAYQWEPSDMSDVNDSTVDPAKPKADEVQADTASKPAVAGLNPLLLKAGVVKLAILTAGVVAFIASALQIYDYFTTKTAAATITVAMPSQELVPISGGRLIHAAEGERIFLKGGRFRLLTSLGGDAHAIIDSISVSALRSVPEPVLTAIAQQTSGGGSEPYSWAGARTINTYYGVIDDDQVQIAFSGDGNAIVECNSENILSCASGNTIVELGAGGDRIHVFDVQLLNRSEFVTGIYFSISYTDGNRRVEVDTETIYFD